MQISGCPERRKQEGDGDCQGQWKPRTANISTAQWGLRCLCSEISANRALGKSAGQLLPLHESAQKLDVNTGPGRAIATPEPESQLSG